MSSNLVDACQKLSPEKKRALKRCAKRYPRHHGSRPLSPLLRRCQVVASVLGRMGKMPANARAEITMVLLEDFPDCALRHIERLVAKI